MKKIKLLFVHSSAGLGGTETNSLQLLLRLDPSQFEAALFCLPGDGPFPRRADAAGIRVLAPTPAGSSRSTPAACWELLTVSRGERFDLVYAFGLKANLVTRLLRLFAPLPVLVAAQRGVDWLRRPWYQRLAERTTAHLVDAYVPNSEAARSVLRHLFSIPEHKLVLIRNGLLPDGAAGPPAGAFENRSGSSVAISIANLLPYKGHQYLLEAMQRVTTRHPELRLLLVGEDCSGGTIPTLVRSLGLQDRVELLGFREDVPALLGQCDFKVLASTEESMPTAVLEAMNAGKPVIASDVGGVREVVDHGRTGLVVPPRDPQALADAMIWMMEHPQEARRMGEAGRNRIREEFRIETMVTQHQALFTALTGSPGTSGHAAMGPQESAAEIARFLDLLACPECRGALALAGEGWLTCRNCGREYPVVRGIPRLLPDAIIADLHPFLARRLRASRPANLEPALGEQKIILATARSFGYEWSEFSRMLPEYERNFWGYMQGLSPEWFQGKVVLDAGCGSGRHLMFTARMAERAIGMDLSSAVEVAREVVRTNRNALVVQGDIRKPPFAPERFDFVYSLGVLHHLPDPKAVLQSLTQLVRTPGDFRIYVYWDVRETPIKRVPMAAVTALRRITIHLPFRLLKAFSFVAAIAGHLAFVLPARVLKRLPRGRALAESLPLSAYSELSFRFLYQDQFDRFSAPIEHRYNHETVRRWLMDCGLEEVRVFANAGWCAHGRLLKAAERELVPTAQ